MDYEKDYTKRFHDLKFNLKVQDRISYVFLNFKLSLWHTSLSKQKQNKK